MVDGVDEVDGWSVLVNKGRLFISFPNFLCQIKKFSGPHMAPGRSLPMPGQKK